MKNLPGPNPPSADRRRQLVDSVTPAFLRRQWRSRRRKRYAVPVNA